MQDLPLRSLSSGGNKRGCANPVGGKDGPGLTQTVAESGFEVLLMLPRHKKALSDMKSAEKKLRDARTKYGKTREALAKAQKGVTAAKARLAAAQDLWES